MYLCSLKIVIVGAKTDAERILRKTQLDENCKAEFVTVRNPLDAGVITPDCAVICDGTEYFDMCAKVGAPFTVLLSECGELAAKDFTKSGLTPIIWTVPDGCRYDERLLSAYFTALVKNMQSEAERRRYKICLETAIDSIPDLVWFKDKVGAHLSVNDGFCKAVEKTKDQIHGRGHYYIWDIPKEEYEQGEYVCLESEDVVIEARKTCLFDEKVKTKGGLRQFKTYKSPLIDTDGSIFGTCGIAHDVTDFQNICVEMTIVLESMPFAVILEDIEGRIISVNRYFERYFGSKQNIVGKNYSDWKKNTIFRKDENSDEREITVTVNGKERWLVFSEQPIYDIFKERIGTIGIFRDITDRRRFERQTIENANTDFLTGLNNRRSLFDRFSQLSSAERLTFITLDLDNFKQVNDSYGHQAGDDALILTARTLCRCFPNDFITRLGGDEFLIITERVTTDNDAVELVNKLFGALSAVYSSREEFSVLTASAGIASCTNRNGFDFEQLMKDSDHALYAAKNSGKSKCCLF